MFQDDDEMFSLKIIYRFGVARQLSCDEEEQEKLDHCPFHRGNGLKASSISPTSLPRLKGLLIACSFFIPVDITAKGNQNLIRI